MQEKVSGENFTFEIVYEHPLPLCVHPTLPRTNYLEGTLASIEKLLSESRESTCNWCHVGLNRKAVPIVET